jgi:lipopolysaccharide exporter
MIAPIADTIKETVQFLNRTDGTLGRKTVRSAVWVAVSNAGLALVSIIRTVILARLLVPEVFGLFSICLLVQRGVEIFTETGLGAALVHRQDRVIEARHTVFTMMVIRGFVVSAIVIILAPFVAAYYEQPVLGPCIQVIAAGFILVGFTNTNTELHRRELNFKSLTYLAQATAVVSLIVTVALAYFIRSIWALVIGQFLTVLAGVILSYLMIEGRPKFHWDRGLARELLSYGKFITGVAIFGFIAQEIDNAVVGKMLGMESLGFYVIAYKLASLPATHFSRVTARMMFPVCSKLQNDLPAMRNMFFKVVEFVGHLAIPVAVGMALMAPEIIQTLYGERWLAAVPALRVLCIYGGVMALGSWGFVFNALGKPHINFYLNVGRAVGISALIYPLTKQFGLTGAAWAVAIPMLVHFAVQFAIISNVLQLEQGQLAKIVGVIGLNSALMAAVLLLSRQVHLGSPILSLTFAMFLGAITYGALNFQTLRGWSSEWNQSRA